MYTKKFILHDYKRCPFCIRTRIMLYLKDIPYEIVEEPLREWTDWMKDWSSANNERPRVPVLREVKSDDSEIIYTESNQINLMLDARDGNPVFTPAEASPEYQKMLDWFIWCDETLKPLIDQYKYGKEGQFDAAKTQEYAMDLATELNKLEAELVGGNYLLGPKMTLADIAIIPFIRQIMRTRGGEFNFFQFPNVVGWTLNLIEAAWFQTDVMRDEGARDGF